MSNDIYELAGYVMASEYRRLVLTSVYKHMNIPSNIALDVDLRTNHVSNVLKELKDKGLVECLNENAKKGRLYKITDLGTEVIKSIN